MCVTEEILKGYIPVAKMIAKMFGPQCEVVIHDLTQPQSSVIFTMNNHVTGREVGQSFDHLVKQVLLSDDFKEDHLAGYEIETADKKKTKSSTALIRDHDGQVIGALCINYALDQMMQIKALLDVFLPGEQHDSYPAVSVEHTAEPTQNVEEIVDRLIHQMIATSKHPNMRRDEKIALVRFMDEKGIFLMKGSVDKVADKLGISKVTVYSYLDEVKKSNG